MEKQISNASDVGLLMLAILNSHCKTTPTLQENPNQANQPTNQKYEIKKVAETPPFKQHSPPQRMAVRTPRKRIQPGEQPVAVARGRRRQGLAPAGHGSGHIQGACLRVCLSTALLFIFWLFG